MCDCKARSAPAIQLHSDRIEPGDPWLAVCRTIVGLTTTGLPRICGTETVGGRAGLHSHHLTVHPETPWPGLPGHPGLDQG